MIAAPVEPAWPRRRWLTVILLLLVAQLALILSLAEKTALPTLAIPDAPVVTLPSQTEAAWPGLGSPAEFVLPNRRGFSGPAWMQVPALPYTLPKWVDPSPPVVTNPGPQLARALAAYVQTNLAAIFQVAAKPGPVPDLFIPLENPAVAQSTLTIEGELARRPLLTQFQLPSWPSAEILTESVVLAGVDQSGNVFSAVLLADGKSGSKEADASALRQVVAARFQPLRSAQPGQPTAAESRLHWGRFVFHWNTIAPPAVKTNPPPAPPPALPITPPHE